MATTEISCAVPRAGDVPLPAPRAGPASTHSVLAAVIGNALEWFDVIVYGFFAATIAKLFFPRTDPAVAVLLSLATFGIAFVIRPVGAIVVGRYADRHGRKAGLVLVSTLMFVGTAMIVVVPTYDRIGTAAPVLLLCARLIQGFSAGGEFGSATAYLAEHSPDRRGFYASWQYASQGMATLLGSLFGLGLTLGLDEAALESWGWRVPFAFGLLIGPAAWFLRHHAEESPEFARRPRSAAAGSASRVVAGIGTVLVATVSLYFMLYMPTFAQATLGQAPAAGYLATLAAGIVLIVVPPITGAISDRRGRMAVALPTAALLAIVPVPLFAWIVANPGIVQVVVAQLLLSIATALYLGVLPSLMADLFPVAVRTTGLSLSYNFAVVGAGGGAPLIFQLLVDRTGHPSAPSLYLVAAALLTIAALLVIRHRRWVA